MSLCERMSDSCLTLSTSLLSFHLLGLIKCLNLLSVDSVFLEFQHCLRKPVRVFLQQHLTTFKDHFED